MARIVDDLRWAARHARRRPAFSLAITATLAVTIASAATAFGLARAVLWRPLPFADAERLVFVWEQVVRDGEPRPARVTGARYDAWRATDTGLSSLALFGAAMFTTDTGSGARTVKGVRVSTNYFQTLGVTPVAGRAFAPGDRTPGHHRVAVLSHGFWQQTFGGEPDLTRIPLRLNGEPYAVVGVMPPGTYPAWAVNPATVTLDADSRQLWVPIQDTPGQPGAATAHIFGALGRLAPGVTMKQATERLNTTSDPAAADPHLATLAPLRDQFVRDARTPLLLLALSTLAVWLIACANLAALQASAFESRRAELSVRAAIGAGAGRIARQIAMETALPAMAAAGVGLLLARAALTAIPAALPDSIPLLTRPSIDWAIVAATAVLAIAACALVTGWPIARLLTDSPAPRGVAARSRSSVYRVLVTAQVAVTVSLVVASGLLAQSLRTVRARPSGFTTDRIFTADLGFPSAPATVDAASTSATEQQVLAAVASLPFVRAAAFAYDQPLEANWSESPLVTGDTSRAGERIDTELRIVSPEYFDTLGVSVLEGRPPSIHDTIDRPGVAVVNERFASALGGRVIGRTIRTRTPRLQFPNAAIDFEIIGVVENERMRGLESDVRPAFYLSTRQFPQRSMVLIAATDGDPLAAAGGIRASIRAVDAGITMDRATSLDRLLAAQLLTRRATTHVISGFAGGALALAAVGLFGLLSISVAHRRREMGVRLAIGASPASLARTILAQSLTCIVAGIALGAVLSFAAGRLLGGMLVEISPYDLGTFAAAAVVFLLVGALAAAIPARRAASINPIIAMKAD